MFVVEPECLADERGFFARVYSSREFCAAELNGNLTESSLSFNKLKGTLRGMHFQKSPHQETKLVRVTRGAAYDVAVDLRPDSPTYLHWHGMELSESNRLALYLPKGFAHGFITLEDDTELFYQITDTFSPESATGFSWRDPAIAIDWPIPPAKMSDTDSKLGNYQP